MTEEEREDAQMKYDIDRLTLMAERLAKNLERDIKNTASRLEHIRITTLALEAEFLHGQLLRVQKRIAEASGDHVLDPRVFSEQDRAELSGVPAAYQDMTVHPDAFDNEVS